METERYVLVSGCMRSGTTLTAGWLGAALAPARLALRESGIPNFAHSMLSALAFHQRDHVFAYAYPEGSPERARMIERLRAAVLGMYADKGWRPGAWIVDKAPYALSDAARFYDHLAELLPGLRHVHLVRDPWEVIASMRARSWGRGPFPRDPHVSPMPFQLETELENLFGDEVPDVPGEPAIATGPRHRSLEQCCLHYNLALRGFLESQTSHDALVIDYQHLVHVEAVRRCVSEFLGTELREGYAFRRRASAPAFEPVEREEIETRLWPETLERRAALRERSLQALAPHLEQGTASHALRSAEGVRP